MKRLRVMSNPWGWSLRGIWHWLSCWAWPYSVHGVEVTSEVEPVYRGDFWPTEVLGRTDLPPHWEIKQRLHVIKRIVKIGPLCFNGGHYTKGYIDGCPFYFDAAGREWLRHPHGRYEAWRTRRRNARIQIENKRRADERAMREGCS